MACNMNTPLNTSTHHIYSWEERKQIFSLAKKIERWPESNAMENSVRRKNSGVVQTSDTPIYVYKAKDSFIHSWLPLVGA